MNRKICRVALLIAFSLPNLVFADDFKSEVLRCLEVEVDDQRLSCFDAMGKALVISERDKLENQRATVEEESGTVSQAIDSPIDREVFPTDLGGKKFHNKSSNSKSSSDVLARGTVTSCKKAVNGKWFFIFENGQVWKQVDSRRRNYHKCNFVTTIKKDGIGFKMSIEGEKRDIRVRRQR